MESLRLLECPLIQVFVRVLENMVATFDVVSYAQLYFKALQLDVLSVWDRCQESLNRPMYLTPKTRFTLERWVATQMPEDLTMNCMVLTTDFILFSRLGFLENLLLL